MCASVNRCCWHLEVHQIVLSSPPGEALSCCGSGPPLDPALRWGMRDRTQAISLQINILSASARHSSQGECFRCLLCQCVREGGGHSSSCCMWVWSEAQRIQGCLRSGARQRQGWDLSPGGLAAGFLHPDLSCLCAPLSISSFRAGTIPWWWC